MDWLTDPRLSIIANILGILSFVIWLGSVIIKLFGIEKRLSSMAGTIIDSFLAVFVSGFVVVLLAALVFGTSSS